MHIFKNVSSSLWSNISPKQSDTLVVMKDIIPSNTKIKHWPRQENRGEVGPSCLFKEGDVPWVLNKDDIYLTNEVILGAKEPCLYGSTLRCYFTIDKLFMGVLIT